MDLSSLPQPLIEPRTLNIDFIFQKIFDVIKPIFNFIVDPHIWMVIGIISIILSILFLTIIIFSFVRLSEMQFDEKREIDNEINKSLKIEDEKNKNANPKWHYILTLIESPNESDWRVAIMEADSMLEELLKEKGVPGETVAELLEASHSDGFTHIQEAWDAHLIRNQIAHQGSEFPLSQVEARRVMKMFQNFFEELGVI